VIKDWGVKRKEKEDALFGLYSFSCRVVKTNPEHPNPSIPGFDGKTYDS
jgi:hypothetical protein